MGLAGGWGIASWREAWADWHRRLPHGGVPQIVSRLCQSAQALCS